LRRALLHGGNWGRAQTRLGRCCSEGDRQDEKLDEVMEDEQEEEA
jgi:hypothetical protein